MTDGPTALDLRLAMATSETMSGSASRTNTVFSRKAICRSARSNRARNVASSSEDHGHPDGDG